MTGRNDLPLEWATEQQLVDELSRRNKAIVYAARLDEETRTTMRLGGDPGWCMALAGEVRTTVEGLTTNGAAVEDEHDARDS